MSKHLSNKGFLSRSYDIQVLDMVSEGRYMNLFTSFIIWRSMMLSKLMQGMQLALENEVLRQQVSISFYLPFLFLHLIIDSLDKHRLLGYMIWSELQLCQRLAKKEDKLLSRLLIDQTPVAFCWSTTAQTPLLSLGKYNCLLFPMDYWACSIFFKLGASAGLRLLFQLLLDYFS